MITPDAAADALSMRTARAIKGNKRRLAELTRVARTAALLATVRTMRIGMRMEDRCGCDACASYPHTSNCAVHNMPAYPNGPCNCSTAPLPKRKRPRGGPVA